MCIVCSELFAFGLLTSLRLLSLCFQALGRVNKIAFDKTGTLTEGNFALRNLSITTSRLEKKEVLEYLALMEAPSSHPLASALVHAARNEGIIAPEHVAVKNHTL